MPEEPTGKPASERGSVARERERLLERERAARAEAEKARQETRSILESISDGFFALDRARRFVYVNREAERFWGKPREELVGKNIREVFPRAAGNEGYRAIERSTKEGVTTEFEMASSVVPGTWVAGRVYPSAKGLSVYFQDITVRKRAEESLKEREEFVRQLLRNFPNGSVNVFDRDLRYLLAEGRGLEEEGLSPEVLVGKTLDELFPKESADFVRPYYRRALAGEDVEFELPLGDRVYSIHAAPLGEVGGEVRTIIAVAQDVTERKRAEEELRESEERFRTLMEQSPLAIHVFAPDGTSLRYNEAWKELWDLEERSAAPNIFDEERVRAAGLVPYLEKGAAGSEEVTDPLLYDPAPTRGRGKPRWLRAFVYPVRDGSGRVFEVALMLEDVTQRKRAQEEYERLLAREWKARAEAEERKRISRELHDRVAHAMGVAHQSLELHQALKHSDPEAARAKMSLAQESTIEAMNLTRNLARELRGAEVQGSFSAALSGLIEAAVPPGVERAVSVEGDEALVPPHAREELFVILREGVRNAVSHSGAGRIDVGVRVCPEEVVGYVADDGRGFAEEEGATRGGVRSMRERAGLVGGTFELSSGSGVGTSIRVTIPLKGGPDNGA